MRALSCVSNSSKYIEICYKHEVWEKYSRHFTQEGTVQRGTEHTKAIKGVFEET